MSYNNDINRLLEAFGAKTKEFKKLKEEHKKLKFDMLRVKNIVMKELDGITCDEYDYIHKENIEKILKELFTKPE